MALAEKHGCTLLKTPARPIWPATKAPGWAISANLAPSASIPEKTSGPSERPGALVTNDENLYEKAKMFRQHGEIERYHHQVIGHNYRMEAIQGAVLGVKLKYLDEWTRRRRAKRPALQPISQRKCPASKRRARPTAPSASITST